MRRRSKYEDLSDSDLEPTQVSKRIEGRRDKKEEVRECPKGSLVRELCRERVLRVKSETGTSEAGFNQRRGWRVFRRGLSVPLLPWVLVPLRFVVVRLYECTEAVYFFVVNTSSERVRPPLRSGTWTLPGSLVSLVVTGGDPVRVDLLVAEPVPVVSPSTV